MSAIARYYANYRRGSLARWCSSLFRTKVFPFIEDRHLWVKIVERSFNRSVLADHLAGVLDGSVGAANYVFPWKKRLVNVRWAGHKAYLGYAECLRRWPTRRRT